MSDDATDDGAPAIGAAVAEMEHDDDGGRRWDDNFDIPRHSNGNSDSLQLLVAVCLDRDHERLADVDAVVAVVARAVGQRLDVVVVAVAIVFVVAVVVD